MRRSLAATRQRLSVNGSRRSCQVRSRLSPAIVQDLDHDRFAISFGSPSLAPHRTYATGFRGDTVEKADSHASAQDGHLALKQHGRAKPSARRKPTLRGAAQEASAPRGELQRGVPKSDEEVREKLVVAYCLAAQYNLGQVQFVLRNRGHKIDPRGTTLSQQVIHIEIPISPGVDPLRPAEGESDETADVFIFPSGNVVTWGVPEANALRLVHEVLYAAGEGHHSVEDEDFGYVEDPSRDRSVIQGETIVLGTRVDDGAALKDTEDRKTKQAEASRNRRHRHREVILAKIAFSSGLARSTKLAVLESTLENYLEGTKTIPEKLMSGNLGSFSRSFIYLKMGQLLDLRRQLNLSSDITDSSPDVFWNTEAALGLETYYDRISAALDVRQRIASLNEKMNYAHEIASILREELSLIREQQSEKHSTRLEWIIILLITVEVMFGSFDLYRKFQDNEVLEVRVVEKVS